MIKPIPEAARKKKRHSQENTLCGLLLQNHMKSRGISQLPFKGSEFQPTETTQGNLTQRKLGCVAGFKNNKHVNRFCRLYFLDRQ